MNFHQTEQKTEIILLHYDFIYFNRDDDHILLTKSKSTATLFGKSSSY